MTAFTGARDLEPLIEARIREAGYETPLPAVSSLAIHLAMTLKWARALSMTSIRTIDAAIERHILESLAAAAYIDEAAGRLLDIGSGNGYPGLAIKCVKPAVEAVLLEPSLRRSIFLAQVISALSIKGIEVRRGRVDRASDLMLHAPLGSITMRAVAAVEQVVSGAAEALSPGGRVVLLIGDPMARDLTAALPKGLEVVDLSPLPGRTRSRLVVLQRR